MGLDIDAEVMKAGGMMNRSGVSDADQIAIVRMLIAVGVEHCLNEQAKIRDQKDTLIAKAYSGLVH